MSSIGSKAPAFRLQNDFGGWTELSELTAAGPVLLVFYPKDFGIVCTKQLCAYQEALENFASYGIKLVGISKNPPDQLRTFRDEYKFQFPLLSDPGHAVAKLYSVTSLVMMGGTSRAVVVVGKSGVVVYRYVEATTITHRKANELLKILEQLKSKGAI